MKNIYTLLLTLTASLTFAQQGTSFEASEGYQPGTLNQQNDWEVTEGSDGFIENQVVTDEFASEGSYSFKNGYESDFEPQWFPVFGASKVFETPADHTNFTFSYDIRVTATLGSDFEFTLFAIDENQDFVPVAGVGIENRGFIYTIKDVNYGFDYAEAQWTPNTWVNVKIEVTDAEVKYYINNVLQRTIANFTSLDIVGYNMLHNNYGADAYYDNFVITSGNLNTKPLNSSVVAVYPNPAQNFISVVMPANAAVADVSIYNLTGQKVAGSKQLQNINISTLAAGTYFLKATSTNGASYSTKIVKK